MKSCCFAIVALVPSVHAGDAKCEILFRPYDPAISATKAKDAGFKLADNSAVAPHSCTAAKPAAFHDSGTTATAATAGGTANVDVCCSSGAKCSTMYVDNGATATGKTACANAGEKVPPTFMCPSVATASTVGSPACAAATETTWAALDKEYCCRIPCATGFQLSGTSDTKQVCSTSLSAKMTYQLSTAANGYCGLGSCGSSDASTCCQLKCTDKYQVKGAGEKDADGATKTECPAGAYVSSTAFCADGTCSDATANEATCCVQKCSDGFELESGTSTTLVNCAKGERISTTKFCSSTTCTTGDASTCCDMKCDDATSGFVISTGTTTSNKCPEKTTVHKSEYCDGRSCADSIDKSTCCQQKCSDGFKLKGATDGTQPHECPESQIVADTQLCKGSSCALNTDVATCCRESCTKAFRNDGTTTSETYVCPKTTTVNSEARCTGACAASDEATCCDMPCSDATKGFKIKGATTKQTLECEAGETVTTKMCSGSCATTDSTTCCMAPANNSSTTAGSMQTGIGALISTATVLCLVSAS